MHEEAAAQHEREVGRGGRRGPELVARAEHGPLGAMVEHAQQRRHTAQQQRCAAQQQRRVASTGDYVCEGRDMGTVVFPDAPLKIFLTASADARAQRRFEQLQARGESVSLARLLTDIKERDARDQARLVSPLLPASDAVVIDSTQISADDVLHEVVQLMVAKGLDSGIEESRLDPA